MIQTVITPAAGKRLIAKSLVNHPAIRMAFQSGIVVIVAGTTNGYVAEELLHAYSAGNEFSRKRFFRGITLPPYEKTTDTGRLPDESQFPGDVVIQKGIWQKGKTIFDIVDIREEMYGRIKICSGSTYRLLRIISLCNSPGNRRNIFSVNRILFLL